MKILESAENYLETILILGKTAPVRATDVAKDLSFTRASVSVAMKNLRDNGFVEVDEQGVITLTVKGKKIAEAVFERHTIISNWLLNLGVSRKTAMEDACKIEHILSDESFEAIKSYIKEYEKF